MVAKQTKKQNVIIKGTKDGLTFFLNDQCSFEALTSELKEKLSERVNHVSNNQGEVKVKLVVGKRYLLDHQMEELREILYDNMSGIIDMVESDVVTKEEAFHFFKAKSIHRVAKIVRSGQVIECEGDLLLVGDVNPGGKVIARGNIYVLGKLLGSAHAGSGGDEDVIIFASLLQPRQIKIADTFWNVPEESTSHSQLLGCAFLNEESKVEMEELTKAMTKYPSLFHQFSDEKKYTT